MGHYNAPRAGASFLPAPRRHAALTARRAGRYEGAMPHSPAVVARALAKRYGDLLAVDGVDFEVARGECFGFLGPNGAGKTTTMRMIYRTAPPTSGELHVLGLRAGPDDRAIKARLGVVPQGDNLDEDLTVLENLLVYARFHGLPAGRARARADELLRWIELDGRAGARVLALSGGMKRRLTIARGLIGDPELLVLDEPTTGLDPQVRHAIWQHVAGLKARGVTLLLTTHYMEEAERLCDRLVIMDRGRIVAAGTPRALVAAHATAEVVEVLLDGDSGDVLAAAHASGERHVASADRVVFYPRDPAAVAARFATRHLTRRRGTLEDVFLNLTGRRLEG
jgi:lipooligosaccharide transport system ATP-binding protein